MTIKKTDDPVSVSLGMYILLILLLSLPCVAQKADPSLKSSDGEIGFISVSGYITVESPEKRLLDSLKWQQQDLLKKTYAGKKINQILLQRSTGRVMIFTRGGSGMQIDKAKAILEGLIAPDPVIQKKKSFYIPDNPFNIYIEKPLFIGISNHIKFTTAASTDSLVAYNGTSATFSGTEHEYDITVSTPGQVIFELLDSATKRPKYLYHFIAKRTADDDLQTKVEVQLGVISGLTVTPDVLKKQMEIKISKGYSLAGATVYLAGTGFKDIVAVNLYETLGFAKCYLDLCLPGSTFTFDNVRISDANGKIYAVDGFTIRVIEDSSQMDTALPDYYQFTSYPQFTGGNDLVEYYVKQQLVVTKSDNIAAGNQPVFLLLKINSDGSVNFSCEGAMQTLNNLEKKCLEIIQNGPKWIPGKFKDVDMPMIVAAAFTLNVIIVD